MKSFAKHRQLGTIALCAPALLVGGCANMSGTQRNSAIGGGLGALAGLRPVLDPFAQGLNAEPNTDIRIVGHTDKTGSDAINDPLSVNRAASARNYLAQHGVDGRRIQIDGRGSNEPAAENNSEAGRARNRRIEIYLAEHAAR